MAEAGATGSCFTNFTLQRIARRPSRFLAHPVTMPLPRQRARKKSVPTSDQWPMVPRMLSRKHENKLREKEMGKTGLRLRAPRRKCQVQSLVMRVLALAKLCKSDSGFITSRRQTGSRDPGGLVFSAAWSRRASVLSPGASAGFTFISGSTPVSAQSVLEKGLIGFVSGMPIPK